MTTSTNLPKYLGVKDWKQLPRYCNEDSLKHEGYMAKHLHDMAKHLEGIVDMYASFTSLDSLNDALLFEAMDELMKEIRDETSSAINSVSRGDAMSAFANPEIVEAFECLRDNWMELSNAQSTLLAVLSPENQQSIDASFFSDNTVSTPGSSISLSSFTLVPLGLFIGSLLGVLDTSLTLLGSLFGRLSSASFLSWYTPSARIQRILERQKLSVSGAMSDMKANLERTVKVEKVKNELDLVVEKFYLNMLGNTYGDGKVLILREDDSQLVIVSDITVEGLSTSKQIMKDKIFTRLVMTTNAMFSDTCPIFKAIQKEFANSTPTLKSVLRDWDLIE